MGVVYEYVCTFSLQTNFERKILPTGLHHWCAKLARITSNRRCWGFLGLFNRWDHRDETQPMTNGIEGTHIFWCHTNYPHQWLDPLEEGRVSKVDQPRRGRQRIWVREREVQLKSKLPASCSKPMKFTKLGPTYESASPVNRLLFLNQNCKWKQEKT